MHSFGAPHLCDPPFPIIHHCERVPIYLGLRMILLISSNRTPPSPRQWTRTRGICESSEHMSSCSSEHPIFPLVQERCVFRLGGGNDCISGAQYAMRTMSTRSTLSPSTISRHVPQMDRTVDMASFCTSQGRAICCSWFNSSSTGPAIRAFAVPLGEWAQLSNECGAL